jgi:hypothetical protein
MKVLAAHDPEKWAPGFAYDHAPSNKARDRTQNRYPLLLVARREFSALKPL